MHLHFRESQHLCCRQKMSRINFIDCRFFAFGCVKPHCQFEIADAKNFSVFIQAGGSYRLTPFYDIISAFPVLGGTGIRMTVRCANQPLEDLEFHKIIAIFQRLAGPHQKSHDPRDAWASI